MDNISKVARIGKECLQIYKLDVVIPSISVQGKNKQSLYTKYIFKFRENWLQDIRVHARKNNGRKSERGTGAKRGRKMNRG
jgi:hypothetical protein